MSDNLPDKLLSTRAVRARYDDICDRTVYRWVEAGELPQYQIGMLPGADGEG